MTRTRQVAHVVPPGAHAGEGVGAFAAELVAASPRARLVPVGQGFGRALGDDDAVLHYVGYGFARRGAPARFLAEVLAWRRAEPERRLLTFFHEIYASGPPWTSAFWLSPVQRRLARRLARASDAVATTLPLYARILAPWLEGRHEVALLPVVSTLGEPPAPPPLAARPPRAVVFGSAGVRGRTWGPGAAIFAAACERLGIDEIVDIGAPLAGGRLPPRLGPARVEALGMLAAPEASRWLLEARAGFMAYPPGFLGKSTIFAAYAAHGLLVARTWGGPSPGDRGDEPGLCWEMDLEPAPPSPQPLADRARAWYGEHTVAVHVRTLGELLA